MKLMPAHDGTFHAEWPVVAKRRPPVAEIHFAPGEAGGVSKEAEHFMRLARRILQRLAEHHEAAALAMDRLRLGKFPHLCPEAQCLSQPARVKLRITAGQPADIA